MITLTRSLSFHAGAEYFLYEDTRRDFSTASHTHAFYQFYLVLEGSLLHQQNNQHYEPGPRDLIFTPAEVWHALDFFETQAHYFCLSFTPAMAAEIFARFPRLTPEELGRQCLFHLSAPMAARLEALLRLLLSEQALPYHVSQSSGSLLSKAILLEFLRSLDPTQDAGLSHSSAEAAVEQCVAYIAAHYAEDLTIDRLAQLCTLSKSDLYRQFPRVTGKTIRRFISDQRILAAAQLVGETDLPISRIAERVGYQDFSTFYRNFVRLVGSPPSEYRKQATPLLEQYSAEP